jgi:iron complex outermembrane recepter protein
MVADRETVAPVVSSRAERFGLIETSASRGASVACARIGGMRSCLLTILLFSPTVCLHAQTLAPERTTDAEMLDTVRVVGAARPRARFPGAVDTLDGAALRDGQRQVNLSEALSRVPGFSAFDRQNYAQDLQIQSRGFGARSTFGIRGLRLVVDGIPASAADGQGQAATFPLSSLDRIDVLRGPLALQYGNAAGGAIVGESVLSDETAAAFDVWAGGDDSYRIGVRFDGAHGKHDDEQDSQSDDGASAFLRWRALVSRFETDGARPQSAAVRNQYNLVAEWTPTPRDRLRIVGNSLRQPLAQDPLGLTREAYERDPDGVDPVAVQFDTRKRTAEDQIGLRWQRQNQESGDGFALGGYRTQRAIEQYLSIPPGAQAAASSAGGVIDLARDSTGFDTVYRWQGEGTAFSIGAEAVRLDEVRRGYENFIGPRLGVRGALRRDERNRVETIDVFAIADVRFGEHWNAIAAWRRSRFEFVSRDRYLRNGDDSGRIERAENAYALGVSRGFERGEVFVGVGSGFETPTINEMAYRPDGGAGFNRDLRPSRTRSGEAGARWRGAWGEANVVAYRIDARDDIVPAQSRGGRASFANAGDTRRQGVEFGLAGAFAEAWRYRVAASWIDARFRESFAFRTAIGPQVLLRTVDAGNRIPGIPRRDLFAELEWRSGDGRWRSALEARAVGEIEVDDRNTDAAAAYTRVAWRGQWHGDNGWSAFVRIDNLFDRRHAGSVIVNEANGRFFEPASGRGVTVGFGWRGR